jgi:hypothetical protein
MLEFTQMDRLLIAVQLAVRVLNPARIQQQGHPLCGPLVLVQDFARRKPAAYVDYVAGLAENRRGVIRQHKVKIKKRSNLLTKRVYRHGAVVHMQEADYIAIASLRESASLFPYRSPLTMTILQGWTFPGQVKGWMESMGYSGVHDRTFNRMNSLLAKSWSDRMYKNHIDAAEAELKQGRVVFLYTAAQFAEHQVPNKTVSDDFESRLLGNYLGGHWTLCRDIDTSNVTGVRFAMDSWGESSERSGAAQPGLLNWSKVTSWYRGYVSGDPA